MSQRRTASVGITSGTTVGYQTAERFCTNGTTTSTKRQRQDTMLAWALRYALAGYPVLPLRGKVPAIPKVHGPGSKCRGECGKLGHGVWDATTDPETLGEMWRLYPHANIGVAMGPNRITVDVDPRNGGTLSALGLDEHSLRTVAARTGGGGHHLVVSVPSGVTLSSNPSTLPGIDLKMDGGYIVVAPSVHPDTGKQYQWIEGLSPWEIDPAPMPSALLERFTTAPGKARKAKSRPAGSETRSSFAEPFQALLDELEVSYSAGAGDQLVPCKFHPDTDPSLHVDPDRAVYFCFSPSCPAHKGGGFRELAELARVQYGIVVQAPGDQVDQHTAAEVNQVVDEQLGTAVDKCPVCGRLMAFQHLTDTHVNGRVRPMFCHNRKCGKWQREKARRKLVSSGLHTWNGWYLAEIGDDDDYTDLRDGILSDHDQWLGSPTDDGNVIVVSSIPFAGSRSVDFRTATAVMAEGLVSIPKGKRIRNPKMVARRRRRGETTEPVVPPAPRPKWERGGLGLDLLSHRDWTAVAAIIEKHGGKVTTEKRGYGYSIPIDGYDDVRLAVASWLETKGRVPRCGQQEIVASISRRTSLASISPQAAYAAVMVEDLGGGLNPAALKYAYMLAARERVSVVIR